MRRIPFATILILLTSLIFLAHDARAQCSANILAALDEEYQTFDVSVWTNDAHCPAGGMIQIYSNPAGAVIIEPYAESFFDVFTEIHTVRPHVMPGPIPPGVPFQLVAIVHFSDPIYPPLIYEETVVVDPLMRLQIYRPTPCMSNVPPAMAPGQSVCFYVCHAIYHVDLGSSAIMGRPVINVVPGCMPGMTFCMDPGCMPGGPNSYRYDVLDIGGRWVLEFEYSDPARQPVCYCVTYTGNLPPLYAVHSLVALDEHSQTLNLTLWTDQPFTETCGAAEVFAYPAGAMATDSVLMFHASSEKTTVEIPVHGGTTGDVQVALYVYLNFGPPQPCPDLNSRWIREDVEVTSSGGLRRVDTGGECMLGGGPIIPPWLTLGQAECMRVCHDIYYIPLLFNGPGIPQVRIWEGCGPPSPCPIIPGCDPGRPGEYCYEVFRIGGTWMLKFEHSNPQHEPVCYCAEFYNVQPVPAVPWALAGLDENRQVLQVSLRSSDCLKPWSGELQIHTNPPGGTWWVESFFDVFCDPWIREIPVNAGGFLPGETFQLEVDADFFGPGSDPFEGQVACENVIVTPAGELALWNPIYPCIGDWVPASMVPGQSACFRVCHRIYEVVLQVPTGAGTPVISVSPGCVGPPIDNCLIEPCMPGGPGDYCYNVYYDGLNWILRFEYSNPLVEPVCYCVTYTGNIPDQCETRQLAALDESYQEFDVSIRTFSPTSERCLASGMITLTSNPPGAYIGPYIGTFAGVRSEWYTMSAMVGPGDFLPGQSFQLVAYINYTDPPYPDAWLTEEVTVRSDGTGLVIHDVGGECTGENVPPLMVAGGAYCFEVCHRVYHIPLQTNPNDPNPPQIVVSAGCFGPEVDHCLPTPCTPGGLFDYRWALTPLGPGLWDFEFEYSNENIEPVCYCVYVPAPPPCETHELVALDEDNQLLKASLLSLDPNGAQLCPMSGTISVWSDPPGLYFGPFVPGFNDVVDQWYTTEIPVAPPPMGPVGPWTIFVQFDYADPNQPDVIETEMVQLNLTGGGLTILDAGGECAAGGGPMVPSVINFGQPECLIVCHDIYYIPLSFPGPGIPVVNIEPGCGPLTPCNRPIPCNPGRPFDYRYNVFRVGGTWILEFEYSNRRIEPVCYCATIVSVTPVPFEAYLLATLDEVHQMFDVTVWTSAGAPPAAGMLAVHANPDMTEMMTFVAGPQYQTFEIPAGPGSLGAGQTFLMFVEAHFDAPVFPPLRFEETAMVMPPLTLTRWDPVTPCVGDHVPPMMDPNTSACFVVCHRVYDIVLNGQSDVVPRITVTPGCYGPPGDPCPPPIPCLPGGPMDYCYRFIFDGLVWHLIFEYSNPYWDPVCYCVHVEGPPPCNPVTDLVVQWPQPPTNNVRLAWTCPQNGLYQIYSTVNMNNNDNPPGPGWILEDAVTRLAGEQVIWYPNVPMVLYKNYVVKCQCNTPTAKQTD